MTATFCPSVTKVQNESWWPGQFLVKSTEWTSPKGDIVRQVLGLCPFCGKWVTLQAGSMLAHTPVAGSDRKRSEKALEAVAAYKAVRRRPQVRAA